MQKIKEILNTLLTIWLLYIAIKYLLIAKNGYTLYSVILGISALTLFAWRIYMFLKNRKKEINPEGYGYIPNMLKASKGLLLDDYKPFEKEIKSAIKEKKPYIIGIDGTKYYTAYIEPDNHKEWNRRYIEMAKEKDIKIIKRNGLDIQETVTLNYVGDDLERYMFVYAQLKERLLQFNTDGLIENIKKLIAPFSIRLDYEKIEKIYQKYANSKEQYIVDFCREEIWHIKDIEAFKEVCEQLKQKGYLFTVNAYASDDRWFGVLDADTVMLMIDLQTIDVRAVNTLLINNIKERYYTYEEQFEHYYASVKDKILSVPHEILYKVDIQKEPREASLSMIGGKGIGLSDENYPKYGDIPMTHLLTLDLNDFPNLKERYPTKRAISLYMNEYNGENEAYEPYTKETAVIFVSQKDIDEKRLTSLDAQYCQKFSLKVTPYAVPKEIFSETLEEESIAEKLQYYFYNFRYVGGKPIWMQNEEKIPNFIMQTGEFLCSDDSTTTYDTVNFAGGIMYMFEDTAFWQCG